MEVIEPLVSFALVAKASTRMHSRSCFPQRCLVIAKQQHKFSCAHVTLFPDGTKERLHGHNYQLQVEFEFSQRTDPFFDFGEIKRVLMALCRDLNEYVLLPANTSRVQLVSKDEVSTEVRICEKRYVFPTDEVIWLPIANIVVEELSRFFWQRIQEQLGSSLCEAGIEKMRVFVTETDGQGASYADCLCEKE